MQFLSIKPGESRMASLTIGVMLFTSMGAALGGTGIETLFFTRFGVDYLPYMFVGLGITSMIMSFGVTALLSRVPKRILYIAIPLFVSGILVLARFALLTRLTWLYPVLWLGKEALNILIAIIVWGVAGAVCDTRQAKRLFPLFNASCILGQVIGGFVTGLLVLFIGIENLLLVWAGTLILAFSLSRTLLAQVQITPTLGKKSRRRQPTLLREMQRGFHYVRTSPLMTWIAFSTIFFSILYFSLSLPFSRAAAQQYLSEDALASFLGLFNGVSTAMAFLVSLFLANKLFARFGIMACILALPVVYLLGFSGLILKPVFTFIVIFRFMQILWLSGVGNPAWQAMFNVVPPEKRDQVRAFISGVPEQAGTFMAGGILIIGEQTLTPRQLYFIGLIAAVCCLYIIHRARRGYNTALIDALHAGHPHFFYSEEQPFGGFHQDAAAVETALTGLRDPDPIVRRAAAEILGHLSLPDSTNALVDGLSDVDSQVRAACLNALSRSNATPALLDIAASLSDPEADVRFEAVSALSTLSASSRGLTRYLAPLLDDPDARVSTRAAVSLLMADPEHERAKAHLRQTAAFGDVDARLHAIQAMGEWRDPQAFDFLCAELYDLSESAAIRSAAARSLVSVNPSRARAHLFEVLDDKNLAVTNALAHLLGQMGTSAHESLLAALFEKGKEDGTLTALAYMSTPPVKPILAFARAEVSRAVEYNTLMRGVQASAGNEAMRLLADALQKQSDVHGMRALRAIGLLGERDAMNTTIENLQTSDASQRANVIEALESISARWRDVIHPLLKLWEGEHIQSSPIDWERLLTDDNEWIRECAAFARNHGELNMDTPAVLSLMDRILFLKGVPLFASLSPADLKQVASIATEETFQDGDVIAYEGEQGDAMFVIISGEVRVCLMKDGHEVEVARRSSGEYVGELSIINREPRIATLIAAGDVRTLCIDQKSFEGLIRERPDVSLVVIRVLSKRLKEAIEQKTN